MKKTKKIILAIIVAIISVISVFSCVKGKYTPEPILSPVSVLKPANSVNDNVINPTGTYDYFYFNTSLSTEQVIDILETITYSDTSQGIAGYAVITWHDDDDIEGDIGLIIGDYGAAFGSSRNLVIGYLDTFIFAESAFPQIGINNAGWQDFTNPLELSITGFLDEGNPEGVGLQNNLLTNLISPVPFLFEGDINYEQSSSGFEDVTQVESLYINTNYTNETLKTLIDEKVGFNDISFSLSDDNTTHTIRINNTTYECYIYLNNNYIYIYNYNETQYDIYWYGYSPTGVDNNLLLFNVDLYSLSGWDNDLNFLFSETNNFGADAPTYEEGYADGYEQGYNNGYSSGVNNVTSNPNDYNLYTYNQYQGNYTNGYNAGEEDGYNRGYLDGLDDGSDTNISFQYIESVLTLIGNFLNIEVLPGIKLSYALGVVIILTIISIIKMVVK